ncbi:hypothetical protein L3X38_000796 [Prunus dulcis]|uniref:Sieve element occlusion N-terminal domain-containing protein n=1 Tax=Prunus dulcis TaxID=3755 RepID=A0AAD4WQY7_PRUDU|nr:hypothetical protein L3X38_000796 [Prunus dulcis]
MASVSTSVSQVVNSTTASEETTEVAKKSVFAMSDTEILDVIYSTHEVSHDHDSFDVHSLFSITQSIIKCSKQIVESIDQKVPQIHAETMEGITITPSFSTPLCVLKSIVGEVLCNAPGEENAHDATLKILNKVSKYSWEAKAVLALAAFSLEYGEFWLTAQHQKSEQLAKSVAFLKGVPVLLKPENLKQRGKAVADLNNVIMSTLQVIDCIFQLEKLSITYNDVNELREILANARKDISVYIYWCIITTVACATNITLLTSDKGNSQDLVQYAQKITIILNKLKQQLKIFEEEVGLQQTYKKLKQLFQIPTEIVEVMKILIFFKHNVETTIFDGSTKTLVDIDILRRKNVLLFISRLENEIFENDITRLRHIYEFTKDDNEYKIVWIPLVKKWTKDLQHKFENLRAKMPWYTVGQAGAHIAGIKYIIKDWNLKRQPILVVLNAESQLQHLNAMPMIRTWGCDALPFTQEKEEELQIDQMSGAPQVRISDCSAKLKDLLFSYFGVPSKWIIDTYTANPTYPKDFVQLRGKKLFLFFSSLDISEAHIKLIKHVNERIKEEKMDQYRTVWIPTAEEKRWKPHMEDNYLLDIAKGLSCYTARPHLECVRYIKERFELYKNKNFLLLVEIDQRGKITTEISDPATEIEKERMKRFGFKP